MSLSLIPHYAFRKFTDISPAFLRKLGVRFLMIDLDNTIAACNELILTDSVGQWVSEMRNSGVELFFISNSRRKNRVENFAGTLKIGFIKGARKPSPDSILQAMEMKGFHAGESALLGDQIFTDTLAANRANVIPIIVKPLSLKNPLFALRFALESPFRAACTGKMISGTKCPGDKRPYEQY